MKINKKIIALGFVASLLAQCPSFAGPGMDGGGHGQGSELLDFTEARKGSGKINFNPEQLSAFQETLVPILNKIKKTYPALYQALLISIESKPWSFVQEPLKKIDDEKIHVLLKNKSTEQIAVQTSKDIKVYRPWYDQAQPLEQAGLLMHEAVMNLAMQNSTSRDAVRDVVRALFSESFGGNFPNADHLKKIIRNAGLDKIINSYNSLSNKIFFQENLEEIKEIIHSNESPMVTKIKINNINMDFYLYMRAGEKLDYSQIACIRKPVLGFTNIILEANSKEEMESIYNRQISGVLEKVRSCDLDAHLNFAEKNTKSSSLNDIREEFKQELVESVE